jgi:uncharacterized membrane protein YqjE
VGGIIEDTQQLIRQEAALARREVKEEWDKTKEAAGLMAGGLTVFAVVAVLSSFTLVKLLQQYVLPNHEWACFAIVTVVFALGGGLLVYAAMARFNQVHMMPQTVESLRQDVEAVSSAVGGGPPSTTLVRQR